LASRGTQCEIDIDLIAVDGDVVDQPERHDIVAEFRIFDRPEAVANGGFVHDDRYFPASKRVVFPPFCFARVVRKEVDGHSHPAYGLTPVSRER